MTDMLKNTVAIFIFISCLFPVSLFAADAAPDEYIPSADLIEGNIRETDVTAAVEVVDVVKERGIPSNEDLGYIIYQVTAKVFHSYRGTFENGDEVVYRYLAEAGIEPLMPKTRHIVSLKKKDEGFIVPDVGYSFPYSDKLQTLYRKAAEKVSR